MASSAYCESASAVAPELRVHGNADAGRYLQREPADRIGRGKTADQLLRHRPGSWQSRILQNERKFVAAKSGRQIGLSDRGLQ